jgi:putative transposase
MVTYVTNKFKQALKKEILNLKLLNLFMICFENYVYFTKQHTVSTVGLNDEVVREYICNQEKEDMMQDNLSTKEYKDSLKE